MSLPDDKDKLWDIMMARLTKAEQSLIMGGWVDNGGELWRPPIGPAPDSLNSLLEKIKHKVWEAYRCQGCGVDEGAAHMPDCPLLAHQVKTLEQPHPPRTGEGV